MSAKRSSEVSRFSILAVFAAVVVGLTFAASKWRASRQATDAGPPASVSPAAVAPDASAPATLAVDAGATPDAIADSAEDSATDDAGDAEALDAGSDAGEAFAVDRALSPWWIEHHTEERGVGVCGGMEATITPRLRFQADGGAIVRELPTIDDACPHGVSRTNTVEKTFDFDGDGAPELLLVTQAMGPAGIVGEESEIWTMKRSTLVPYRPADASTFPSFSEVEDVDEDGRPDLLSRLSYTQVGTPPCGVGFVVAPIFVFHSRPGGSFTRADAVAKKHLDKVCGAGALPDLLQEEGDIGTAIACARVRGRSADAVALTLVNGCGTFSDTACDPTANDAGKRTACPAWALTLAKQATPTAGPP